MSPKVFNLNKPYCLLGALILSVSDAVFRLTQALFAVITFTQSVMLEWLKNAYFNLHACVCTLRLAHIVSIIQLPVLNQDMKALLSFFSENECEQVGVYCELVQALMGSYSNQYDLHCAWWTVLHFHGIFSSQVYWNSLPSGNRAWVWTDCIRSL